MCRTSKMTRPAHNKFESKRCTVPSLTPDSRHSREWYNLGLPTRLFDEPLFARSKNMNEDYIGSSG